MAIVRGGVEAAAATGPGCFEQGLRLCVGDHREQVAQGRATQPEAKTGIYF